MGKKPRGLFAGRALLKRKHKFRFSKKGALHKFLRDKWKFDPLEGAPMAEGIVLELRPNTPKKPSSGNRQCAVVSLKKNNVPITAYIPYPGGKSFIEEHNTVVVERIGGAQHGARGDLPGVKFKIIKVNGVPLKDLVSGKKQKPVR
ncbi:MAG: 30S ribosomal protein S12 [Candidatus Parvarchaeota archaeon]|nr:30S ribosomal protein S12 [Candidatus Rehaiarchaeum fermentans]MCW1293138.1 30S ribosomal protein S12 [Candidatus Rehaiarchaeum fermentans]